MNLILADVPVTSEKVLKALAAEAPPEPVKQPTQRPPGRGRSSRPDLGSLLVEKYLTHYGVEYTTKAGDGKKIFKLRRCLFDPAHKKNEAAIIQDVSGKITYQCFHDSCKGRTWSDARRQISGAENLAQFCEGYDPNQKPRVTKQELSENGEAPYLSVSSNGRVSFNVARFRSYLYTKLSPLINEGKDFGGLFYQYVASGLWVPLSEAAIRKLADDSLGDYSDPRRISNTVTLLADRAFVPAEKLLPDPMWINMRNCMLHLPTMDTAPHAPSFYSRVQLPINYNPEAKCTRWISSLIEILNDDPNKITTIQEFFGYCLYPKIIFPCALFQIGPGGNGKGTVQRVLETMLGEQNVCHISLQRMEDKWGPIELKDKLLNACGETSTTALEVTHFKQIAAADRVQAEVKFGKDVKYIPIAKHLISMNEFPGVKDKTDAFFRRLIVMEYKQKFEGEFETKNLGDKLVAEELDGIFIWALEGLKRVLEKEEISMPESVIQAKKRFKARVNHVVMYVDEQCDLGGPECKVGPPTLYKDYLEWCEESNIRKEHRKGKQGFYEQILTNFQVTRGRRQDPPSRCLSGSSSRPG